jgi:hypothetical protein
VRILNEVLAARVARGAGGSPASALLADDELAGGGIHVMRSGGNLDVHVDFNLLQDRKLFRRLNILVFLNEGWRPEWQGALELWDDGVRHCEHRFLPELNRCVIFERASAAPRRPASPVRPRPRAALLRGLLLHARAPANWSGRRLNGVQARPDRHLKRYLLMPASAVTQLMRRCAARAPAG